MLNYHKTYRESLDKSKRNPTAKKQPTINRSHTSSINLKISSDLQQLKGSIKNIKQNYDPLRKQSINQNSHSKSKSNIKNDPVSATNQFKYSFKIKQDCAGDYTNGSRLRMKTNYEQSSSGVNMKPFRQSNRCLITQRNQKQNQNRFYDRSSTKKSDYHIKTQYKQNFDQQDFGQNLKINFQENDFKMKKQSSTKHNTQSISSSTNNQVAMVKIPLSELKKLYEQYKHYENEVEVLQKQLKFYHKTSSKSSKNSVVMALAE